MLTGSLSKKFTRSLPPELHVPTFSSVRVGGGDSHGPTLQSVLLNHGVVLHAVVSRVWGLGWSLGSTRPFGLLGGGGLSGPTRSPPGAFLVLARRLSGSSSGRLSGSSSGQLSGFSSRRLSRSSLFSGIFLMTIWDILLQ